MIWLQGDSSKQLTPEELERLELMHTYVLSNAHFYCETVDITHPFPSSSHMEQPSWEFVWNRWLSTALRAVGLPTHCPHLLQVLPCCSVEVGSITEQWHAVLLDNLAGRLKGSWLC